MTLTRVEPRPRQRPQVAGTKASLVSPPVRARVRPPVDPKEVTRARALKPAASWIKNHRALHVGYRSHNGVHGGFDAPDGSIPDQRFAPLVIVPDPDHMESMPPTLAIRWDAVLALSADSDFSKCAYIMSGFMTEWALRYYSKKACMADDVFEAITQFIKDNYHEKLPLLGVHRDMIVPNDTGLDVDLTRAVGPWILATIPPIEKHYADRLRCITA